MDRETWGSVYYVQFRLYLRVEGNVDRVDMFEIEVVENIPLTKVYIIAFSLLRLIQKKTFIRCREEIV